MVQLKVNAHILRSVESVEANHLTHLYDTARMKSLSLKMENRRKKGEKKIREKYHQQKSLSLKMENRRKKGEKKI